jgi:hypothetical protein
MSDMRSFMRAHIEQTSIGKRLMESDSLQSWLVKQVDEVLERTGPVSPLLVWCDPYREWLDLLRVASQDGRFELWAPPAGSSDEHELLVRDRFHSTPRAARVVWLPCGREEITWFTAFELEAEAVWEKSLLEALGRRRRADRLQSTPHPQAGKRALAQRRTIHRGVAKNI